MQTRLEIRDPVHGAIPVTRDELGIIDRPLFQRLRHIKQLGFSDLSFPGATHSRYLHSIGVMHLAGRAFDTIFGDVDVPPARRDTLRRLVRRAALLHDVGHAPFSHAAEFAMPPLRALLGDNAPDRRATHEDFTLRIVTSSALTHAIDDPAFPAAAVAALIDPDVSCDPDLFEAGGVNWRPLLQQLISSELDCDRMDYLVRDAHFAGVHYGVFDVHWLLSNLGAHIEDGRAHLALSDRAIYAFDDFLIARHHMFLMVYFHYRSVAFEEMLRRWFEGGGDGFRFPADLDEYVDFDDASLFTRLRRSADPWARRIVLRREYKMLLERHGTPGEVDLRPAMARLTAASIPHFLAESRGQLSKYFHGPPADPSQRTLPFGTAPSAPAPIFVMRAPYRGAKQHAAATLVQSTDLFRRYGDQLRLSRLYVADEDLGRAGAAVDGAV